jgi:hypothetical protein
MLAGGPCGPSRSTSPRKDSVIRAIFWGSAGENPEHTARLLVYLKKTAYDVREDLYDKSEDEISGFLPPQL